MPKRKRTREFPIPIDIVEAKEKALKVAKKKTTKKKK